jgi:hypothetical protein
LHSLALPAATKLQAHPDKTEIIDFVARDELLAASKPMNYLGFTFDGQHKRIRPGSIARFYKKMRLGVGRAKAIRYRTRRNAANQLWTPLRRRKLHLLYAYMVSAIVRILLEHLESINVFFGKSR